MFRGVKIKLIAKPVHRYRWRLIHLILYSRKKYWAQKLCIWVAVLVLDQGLQTHYRLYRWTSEQYLHQQTDTMWYFLSTQKGKHKAEVTTAMEILFNTSGKSFYFVRLRFSRTLTRGHMQVNVKMWALLCSHSKMIPLWYYHISAHCLLCNISSLSVSGL